MLKTNYLVIFQSDFTFCKDSDCFLNMIFVHAETISFDILFVNVLNQLILALDFQNNIQHDRKRAKAFHRLCTRYHR